MASPSDRPATAFGIAVSAPPQTAAPSLRLPQLHWLVVAGVGGAACVLLGWLLVGFYGFLAWVAEPSLQPSAVTNLIGETWLATHGVRVALGTLTLGMKPLGLTLVVMAALYLVTGYALHQRATMADFSRGAAVRVVVVTLLSYTALSMVVGTIVGDPRQAVQCGLGAVVVSLLACVGGAVSAVVVPQMGPLRRGLVNAVVKGFWAMAAVAVLMLVAALVAQGSKVAAIQGALAPDALGQATLVFVYLAFAPNMLAASGSYAIGSGFSVGTGTLVSPTSVKLGIMPGIPLWGALPAQPVGAPWLWWVPMLLVGAIVGTVLSRSFRAAEIRPGLVAWSLRAAFAGMLVSAAWSVCSWVARGDLGKGHLVGIGAVFPGLVTRSMVGFSVGAVVATVAWVLHYVAQDRAEGATYLDGVREVPTDED